MKIAKGLGLFVALALLGTGCGKGAAPAPQGGTERADVQAVEDGQGKEAKPNAQENAEDAAKTDAAADVKTEEELKAAQTPQAGNKGGNADTSVAAGTGATASTGSGAGKQGGTSAANGGSASAPAVTTPPPAPKPQGELQLSVTHNFGSASVFSQTVSVGQGQSLLDVMRDHLEVETAYGGGFVNSINGTKSAYTDKSVFTRKKIDWFYYINGSVGAVGSDAYTPHSGDLIWWDYHAWSGQGNGMNCVVGAYPHPFTTGFNGATPGTVIYYGSKHADDANRLADGLRKLGAGNVSTAAYADGSILHSTKNVIVLGTWSELSGQSAIGDIFGDPTRTGVYAQFDGDAVTALNHNGKSAERSGQGAILATGQGSGDTSPTWLVLGATEAGLDAVVDTMIHSPAKLKGKIGVVLDGSDAIAVPVAP